MFNFRKRRLRKYFNKYFDYSEVRCLIIRNLSRHKKCVLINPFVDHKTVFTLTHIIDDVYIIHIVIFKENNGKVLHEIDFYFEKENKYLSNDIGDVMDFVLA